MSRLVRLLPNALTASRGVLAVPVLLAAVRGAWALGCGLFVLALLTDFLDGLAAKKLNAQTSLGARLDPVADAMLASGGMLGLCLAHDVSWWWVGAFLVPWCAGGYVKYFVLPAESPWVRRSFVVTLPMLLGLWMFELWEFAARAFGWTWWYVIATGALLTCAALLKRHRLRAWFGWTGIKV